MWEEYAFILASSFSIRRSLFWHGVSRSFKTACYPATRAPIGLQRFWHAGTQKTVKRFFCAHAPAPDTFIKFIVPACQ
jgi:hypothetical protein